LITSFDEAESSPRAVLLHVIANMRIANAPIMVLTNITTSRDSRDVQLDAQINATQAREVVKN
jgi:hypothetical protein